MDNKKVLVVNNNESIVMLFEAFRRHYKVKSLVIVNGDSPEAISTVAEAVKKIKNTDFDILVIGHKLSHFAPEKFYAGTAMATDEETLDVLENPEIKNILKNKVVISDGLNPGTIEEIRNLYRELGVNHFINRTYSDFKNRFENMLKCLDGKCDCASL
ncbi:MAG: hypothetical protein L6Q29_04505 [Candidatus Pacebacteria bacterium]|nr:hypothetical protein [Candidatus Paceibacterota bacterium]NUQ57367.1 hypothetical protein [Candidatus Paceibacter sp.]